MEKVIGYLTLNKNGQEFFFEGSERPRKTDHYWKRDTEDSKGDIGIEVPQGTMAKAVPIPSAPHDYFDWHFGKSIIEIKG